MKVVNGVRNGAIEELEAGVAAPSASPRPPKILDLRSDVVTPPTPEMWEAMHAAGFSGTPLDDDKTVKELEEKAARLLGKEAAFFVPTCTVANILALMTLGERGTQVILDKSSHIATSEEWGLAYICGLVPHLLQSFGGVMNASQLQSALSQSQSVQKNRTCLVCLENSHTNSGGVTLSVEETRELSDLAKRHGAAVHLDGARLFNAAAALNASPAELAAPADTVSISLNKGLSAPYGALLCGKRYTMTAARKNARRIGAATIHKAATLAAAGIVALENRGHLIEDNRRAYRLALLLNSVPGLTIDLESVQTNLVRARLEGAVITAAELETRLAERGVLVLLRGPGEVRFVLHRSIDDAAVEYVAETVTAILS